MWTHIRLADRRGLLTGDLSPVQQGALQIVMGREAIAEIRSLMASIQPQEEEEEYEDEDSGTWVMPEFDPHDAEALMREMGQTGTIRMEDLPLPEKE